MNISEHTNIYFQNNLYVYMNRHIYRVYMHIRAIRISTHMQSISSMHTHIYNQFEHIWNTHIYHQFEHIWNTHIYNQFDHNWNTHMYNQFEHLDDGIVRLSTR